MQNNKLFLTVHWAKTPLQMNPVNSEDLLQGFLVKEKSDLN